MGVTKRMMLEELGAAPGQGCRKCGADLPVEWLMDGETLCPACVPPMAYPMPVKQSKSITSSVANPDDANRSNR